MARSRDYILTLVLLLLIIVIISGSLIFEAERSPDVAGGPGEDADGKSPLPAMEDALEEQDNAFHHVPDVFWFVVSELKSNLDEHARGFERARLGDGGGMALVQTWPDRAETNTNRTKKKPFSITCASAMPSAAAARPPVLI